MNGFQWMSREVLEDAAERLLRDYGEKITPVVAPPVPIEHILEGFCGLELVLEDLNPGKSERDILGELYLEDRLVRVDSVLATQEGRYHFTLAHEVGHWHLHRDMYLKAYPLSVDGKIQPLIICRKSENKKPIERQTDYFAGALLMPRRIVGTLWEKNNQREEIKLDDPTDKFEKTIYYYAIASLFNKQFRVSLEAMRIRLQQLGLLRLPVRLV